MDIQVLHKIYKINSLIDTDSRSIRKGSVFFALKGDNFNGNAYALQSLDKGASYAVVDEYISNDDRLILVKNVLETLQELASFHRNSLNIPILALTGSNGKTTTKELINVVLQQKFMTKATFGNLNNHIGVPLTLLSIKDNIEFGIIEMGANHPKEIEFLSSIVNPDFGYITNFGKAHLEGFGSLEGVIESKSELYDNLISNNKTIFVNSQDINQVNKTINANTILLNTKVELVKTDSPLLSLDYDGDVIETKLIGEYNLDNIRAAITIGEYFKIDKLDIIKGILSYIPKNNRSQIIEINGREVILDAYNANPTSMEAAIINFSKIKSFNKCLILGDMFELGKDSKQEHQKLVEIISKFDFDKVFLLGKNFYETKTDYMKFIDFNSFLPLLQNQLKEFKNLSILIKGSRGMKLERVLDYIN